MKATTSKKRACRPVFSLVVDAHIAELQRQRDVLFTQVEELRARVQEIPSLIAAARLDAKEGRNTYYDYRRAARACEYRL